MNTSVDEIKEKTRAFLLRFIKNHNLNDDDDIFARGFVNSLFAMQLILFVEKEFSMKVENEDLDLKNFNSLNAISEFVTKKAGSSRNRQTSDW